MAWRASFRKSSFPPLPPYQYPSSSQLKLLRTPFQEDFLSSPDIPWGNGEMTVRAIGEGAGNMTYLLLDGAGHFVSPVSLECSGSGVLMLWCAQVVKDQPKLAKYIVETWIENEPWF